MSKKKRKKLASPGPTEAADPPAMQQVPGRLASPFRDALSGLKKQMQADAKLQVAAKPVPQSAAVVLRAGRQLRGSAAFTPDDKSALSRAMLGVKRLDHAAKPVRVVGGGPPIASRTAAASAVDGSVEDSARARLDALVAEDVNFRIEREDGHVTAARVGLPPRVVRELMRRTRVDGTLDLHGLTQRQAQEAVVSFIRRVKREGLDLVRIVHGKGKHSEDGVGVLCDVVIASLTGSGAAAHVRAFVTAPDALGGSGALLVDIAR